MNTNLLKPNYQASRWLKVRLLLSIEAMQELVDHLEPVCFIQAASVMQTLDPLVPKKEFLAAYAEYMHHLEKDDPQSAAFAGRSPLFKLTLCASPNLATTYEVKLGSFLTRLLEPGVQLRPCLVDFSSLSKQFSYSALGLHSISWGLEFSYPQLIQKHGEEVANGLKEPFVNGILFKKIQKWARRHTRLAAFTFEGEKIISELRIGPNIDWACEMSEVKKRGLKGCELL